MIRVFIRIGTLLKRRPSLNAQGGFTFFHALVGFMIAGVGMTGAWMAYWNFQMQARIAFADQQMDAYATSALQDLNNMLSWSWGGAPPRGQINGSWNSTWSFMIKDDIPGNSPYNSYTTHNGLLTIGMLSSGGIQINSNQPPWARNRNQGYYIWRGRPSVTGSNVSAFDRRDGMTMTGLMFDYPAIASNLREIKYAYVGVEMRMQYRYSANSGISLFSNQYIHERTYRTRVFLRNWDVESNAYRDQRLAAG
jgi:hypothetical protein